MGGMRALYKDLYEMGNSTYWIAEYLGVKPNTVRKAINDLGIVRRRKFQDIEKMVARRLAEFGYSVKTQRRGDAPFDLLVDGLMVDVKSSSLLDYGGGRYSFDLIHKNGAAVNCCDYYILVMKVGRYPVYRLLNILTNKTLTICSSLNTKHNIEFMFNLYD